ncbi:cysteinyl leukotriene receptor 1-like [Spea bombifrons]|uniref:cysteinyl leukotriene receptor 1-like n=1 Tax=Spea bombifrons TaxID=233779 RepID=UPI00234A19C9|nr:cysteinyl leukotriene receptor 1-like [Spea bombifrons]
MAESSINNQSSLGSDNLQCKQDDSYKYHVYSAVYLVVFFFGLLFNGIALYIFCKINKNRGASTICLMNLACADLFFVIFLPLRISYFQKDATWIFGDVMCRITTYSFYVSMYSSIIFLAVLSFFRYFSFKAHTVVRTQTVVNICIAVWVFAGVSTSPFLLSGTHIRENVTRCFEPSSVSSWTRIMYMNYYALIAGFTVPFLIIVVCNGLLIRHILKIPMEKKHIHKQVAKITLVLLVCSVCFLPYHIQRTVHLHYMVHHPDICSLHYTLQRTVVATLCLAVFNICLDPLLYVFIGHGFKSWLLLLCRSNGTLHVKPSSSESDVVREVLVDGIQMEESIKVQQ